MAGVEVELCVLNPLLNIIIILMRSFLFLQSLLGSVVLLSPAHQPHICHTLTMGWDSPAHPTPLTDSTCHDTLDLVADIIIISDFHNYTSATICACNYVLFPKLINNQRLISLLSR